MPGNQPSRLGGRDGSLEDVSRSYVIYIGLLAAF
jgi:hypothetical protein